MALLPPGFEELDRFVDIWALDDTQARYGRRYLSNMVEIQEFYQAMQPRAEDALRALESQPINALEGEWRRLYQMLMALAHVAHAVERHKQPRAPNTTYPTSMQILRGMLPA